MKSPRLVAGRYELLTRLGRGGSSTVWLARDRVDEASVALKWIRGADPAAVRQARAEISALRTLQVPGVVALRDEGVARGRTYVVMERVDGAPFPGCPIPCDWAALEGPLVSLLEVLARVHVLGVVHRDLKPGNVLVRDGRAVLVDFGIARFDASWRSPAADGASTWGTLAYMAPEAWAGDDDPRSDLYAVGVMAYRALTGRFPFPVRGEPGGVLARRAHAGPPPWAAVDLPAPVRPILARLLEPRPDARPGSAAEVVAALRATMARSPGEERSRILARPQWSQEALRGLFQGPDRLLHLPEDAARILYARTAGESARVVSELDRWQHAGVARRVGEVWAVRRVDLDRLVHEVVAPSRGSARPTGDDAELVEWLQLAAVPVRVEALRAVTGWPARRVSRSLRSLLAAGLVVRQGARRVALAAEAAPTRWSPGRRREAHARLAAALPALSEGRLQHLFLARADAPAISAEAHAVANSLAERGQLLRAEEVLREGARALRVCDGATPADFAVVLGLWARVAVEQWTPHALDRLRYELAAPEYGRAEVTAIAALLEAAYATLQWTPQASELVVRVRSFDDPNLELVRQEVRVNAARCTSVTALRRVLGALQRSTRGGDLGRRLCAWEARLANAEGSYEAAARGYERSARGEPWVSRRHREILNAASAWIEVGRAARASRLIARVREDAERLRLPVTEGRAIWLQRTLAWRAGEAPEPDPEWVDAACKVDPVVARLMAYHESILAWHRRDRATLQALLARAAAIEGASSELRTWSLLEAMAADLGLLALDREAREARVERVAALVPAIALQVAALTWPGGAADAREAERALLLAASVPRAQWSRRLDVLSVDACLARLGVAAP